MAVGYNIIQRSVLLRSNELQANSASDLAFAYAVPTIGQNEIVDRGIEFPALAVNDAICNALQAIVRLIGLDKDNPYRNFVGDTTVNLGSGALIPVVSSNSKPRIGVIGSVRHASTGEELLALPKQNIFSINALFLKQTPLNYFTDNVRIWHTCANVICDIVVLSTTDELTKMKAIPDRGLCPLPEDLIPVLIDLSLSKIARDVFNAEQAIEYDKRAQREMERLGFKFTQSVLERVATD